MVTGMAAATVINAMAVRLDRYIGDFCMIGWRFLTMFGVFEKGFLKKYSRGEFREGSFVDRSCLFGTTDRVGIFYFDAIRGDFFKQIIFLGAVKW